MALTSRRLSLERFEFNHELIDKEIKQDSVYCNLNIKLLLNIYII